MHIMTRSRGTLKREKEASRVAISTLPDGQLLRLTVAKICCLKVKLQVPVGKYEAANLSETKTVEGEEGR